MLSDSSRLIAENFWSTELGAPVFCGGVHIQAHDPCARWNLADRAVYFEHAAGSFITVQQEVLPELRRAFQSSSKEPCDTFIEAMATKGTVVGNGPAYVGYLDSLKGAETLIRRVDRADPLVQTLAQQHPEDWDVFGLTEQSVGPFAVVDGGRVLGLSHYEVWGGVIAHIGVITIPSARGRGIGELTVRQATQEALRSGLLPQYRTLWANKPSIRIAEKIGFSHFATTVVVRCGER